MLQQQSDKYFCTHFENNAISSTLKSDPKTGSLILSCAPPLHAHTHKYIRAGGASRNPCAAASPAPHPTPQLHRPLTYGWSNVMDSLRRFARTCFGAAGGKETVTKPFPLIHPPAWRCPPPRHNNNNKKIDTPIRAPTLFLFVPARQKHPVTCWTLLEQSPPPCLSLHGANVVSRSQ